MTYFRETHIYLSPDTIHLHVQPERFDIHIEMIPSRDYEFIDSIKGTYHGRLKTYVTNFSRAHIDSICSCLRGRGTLRERINEICPSLDEFLNGFLITLIVTEFWNTDDFLPLTRRYGIKPKNFTHLRELAEILKSDTHPWLREISAWSSKYYQAFLLPDKIEPADISSIVAEVNLLHKKMEVELLRVDEIRSEIEDSIEQAGRTAIMELQAQLGCITDEIIRRCIHHIKNNVDVILTSHLSNIEDRINKECSKVLEAQLPLHLKPYLNHIELLHQNTLREVGKIHQSIVEATLLPQTIMNLRDRVMKLESRGT